MKRLLLVLFISFSVFAGYAQEYTVIHVIGKIYDANKEMYLTPGYRLEKSSKLKFEETTARAAVLSKEKGRYVIQQSKESGSQNDLLYSLASVITPARGKLSTRAGGINNALDFQKRFAEPVVWIGDNYKLEVSKVAFPTNENQFFYASYSYNNETINKKLDCTDGVLAFNQNSFFKVDDVAIVSSKVKDIVLHYYNSSTKESTELTPISFALVSKSDFCSLQENLGEKDSSKQVEAIYEILSSLYGQCDKEYIKAVIEDI